MWATLNKIPEKLFWICVICGFVFEDILPACLLMILLLGMNELVTITINLLGKKYSEVQKIFEKFNLEGVSIVKDERFKVTNIFLIIIVWTSCIYIFFTSNNNLKYYAYFVIGTCLLARGITLIIAYREKKL